MFNYSIGTRIFKFILYTVYIISCWILIGLPRRHRPRPRYNQNINGGILRSWSPATSKADLVVAQVTGRFSWHSQNNQRSIGCTYQNGSYATTKSGNIRKIRCVRWKSWNCTSHEQHNVCWRRHWQNHRYRSPQRPWWFHHLKLSHIW